MQIPTVSYQINKIGCKNSIVNFASDLNTRELMALAESDDYVPANCGKAKVEKFRNDKKKSIAHYKKENSHGGFEIYRTCTRKSKRFENENLAAKAAKNAQKKFGKNFRIYYCKFCDMWHLTCH